ncbi:MAG: tetratricopeptide repeat protein [Coriobacteriia bacterium]|nr:tetratricopeptide repeat protein [Coriobacteriia bacterium]
MDEARFREAEEAYAAGDLRAAAKAFLASAGRGKEGNGAAYHRAGNSLMRLRRYSDAVTVYGHALMDEIYEKRGAVWANLGTAQAATGAYDEAVRAYREALEEPGYDADHKALQGMAGALWEMGRVEDAALAYRQAALDTGNRDPGKALNNLGLCLMRLDRPEDAIEAYKAALELPEYKGKGRAAANLGVAFASVGKHEDAIRAFEKAVALYDHTLSPDTAAVYEASRRAATGRAGDREIVEGWVTGEMPPVAPEVRVEEVPGQAPRAEIPGSVRAGVDAMVAVPPGAAVPTVPDATAAGEQGDRMADFFNRTEEQMRESDRAARRDERRDRAASGGRKGPGLWVAGALATVVVLVSAYAAGLGYPTQSGTVKGLLHARGKGTAIEGYWVAVPEKDIDKEMAKVPPSFQGFTIGGVDRSASRSVVEVTLTLDRGAPLRLKLTLAREGVGWKVTGVENDWRSTGGGS